VDERRANTVMLKHEFTSIREQLVAMQKEMQHLWDGR
jgi:hypothetical protein